MRPREARIEDSYDEDLRRALEMSLDEVKDQKNSGFVSQSQLADKPSVKAATTDNSAGEEGEDEDAELKAAIAASLQDMEEQKKKHAATLQQQTRNSTGSMPSTFMPPKNDYELTPVEAENINLFSTLVDRLQGQPRGTILREPQIQELYESIGTLRPKLARTYGETMSKHDTLLDLHAKLSTVVRYYDRMLEERLSNTYNNHNLGGYALPPQAQRPASAIYPNLASSNVNASRPTGAESFYTGSNAPQSDSYVQAPQTYSNYGPQSPQTHPQEHLSRQPSSANYVQRTDSYQQQATYVQQRPPSSQANSLSPSLSHAQPNSHEQVPQPQSSQAPHIASSHHTSHVMLHPTQTSSKTVETDPGAYYYHNNAGLTATPVSQHAPPAVSSAPLSAPSAPPQGIYQQSSQIQPQRQPQPHPPSQPQAQPTSQNPYPPAQANYPQWQQPPQTQRATNGGYSAAAFPSAPQHQPQTKVAEESLIDL